MTETNDCFAKQGSKCSITSNKHCPKSCRFYKTPERFRKDFLLSKARLKKLGILGDCQNRYVFLSEMCGKIKA